MSHWLKSSAHSNNALRQYQRYFPNLGRWADLGHGKVWTTTVITKAFLFLEKNTPIKLLSNNYNSCYLMLIFAKYDGNIFGSLKA